MRFIAPMTIVWTEKQWLVPGLIVLAAVAIGLFFSYRRKAVDATRPALACRRLETNRTRAAAGFHPSTEGREILQPPGHQPLGDSVG